MNKISKTDIKQRDEIFTRIKQAAKNIEAKIEVFNKQKEALIEELQKEVTAYNEAAKDFTTWKEDREEEIKEYFNSKSEKWQEGDKGQAVERWAESWNDFPEIEEIEIEDIGEIELPDGIIFEEVDLGEPFPDDLAE